MKISIIAASIFFGLSFATSPAYAQTVKKWVDEDGVTHYSDQKPADGDSEVREIDVPDAGVTEFDSEEASQRIKKQAQQLEQDRKAREQEAREKEEARALEEALEREPIVVEEKKKKKKNRGKKHRPGETYPRPPPGPFPKLPNTP